tara:strand:- start:381 stop:1247 length:867 start_codon:yes stop_codon:yes gene_type:complete
MYPPIYRYDQSHNRLFFDLLRRANGVVLNEDDVQVSYPRSEGRIHTSVVLSPSPRSPLSGQVRVFYDRLDLERFFFGVPLSFSGLQDVTPETISNALLGRWSVYIDPDDLLVTINTYREHHPSRLLLCAKETSLTWVGEVEAWLLPDGYLGSLFQSSELSFNDRNVKQNAFLYSIDRQINGFEYEDVSWLVEGLRLHTLTTQSTRLLEQLLAYTGDHWAIKQHKAPFNLKDAVVLYHGPWDASQPKNRVIVLQLGPDCENLFGHLILYYGTNVLEEELVNVSLSGFSH